MSVYFFDTSGIVKRYVVEQGTNWVRQTVSPSAGHRIFVSRITEVEAISAIARRHREAKFDLTVANGLRTLIHRHFSSSYTVIDVNSTIVQLSVDLLFRHPLRAYDAVQLATALIINQRSQPYNIRLNFVCADTRLLNVAQAEGLQTDDPNQY